MEKHKYCRDLIQNDDPDHYLISLYAPQDKRNALYALFAFNYEISKISYTVSEPMLGEIRLQWWREVINDIYQDKLQLHDIVPSLAEAIERYALPKDLIMAMIDGRSQELYPENPDNIVILENYLSLTAGNLSCLMMRILGNDDLDILANKLGLAWGYVGIMRSISYNFTLGKKYIPLELMTKNNIYHNIDLSSENSETLKPVIFELYQKAEEHLDYIRNHKDTITPETRSAFLLCAITRHYMKIIKKTDFNLFHMNEKKYLLSKQWAVLMAALFNRF